SWTAPIYPHLAERTRLVDTIEVETEVGQDGAVRTVTARPATLWIAAAAEAAACRWRFAPAGMPVRKIFLRFSFSLRDGAPTAPGPELAEAYHVRLWTDGPPVGGGS